MIDKYALERAKSWPFLIFVLFLVICGPAYSDCLNVNPQASISLGYVIKNKDCRIRMSSTGYPLPDHDCTPGAVNPTLTIDVLSNSNFRTSCVRNKVTSEKEKHIVYSMYGIIPPKNNKGKNQVCELDHLIPLEDGGADTLDNIWPQCGLNILLSKRWFKIKDEVETFLAKQIKNKSITDLDKVQYYLAEDWSQFY